MPDEPFYFGFWRVVIRRHENSYRLYEWDFERDEFIYKLGKSLCLWYEQKNVCASQDLPWTSVGIEHLVYATPSVFEWPIESTIEGLRNMENAPGSSGWFLYTEKDREENRPFQFLPLYEVLRKFNVNVSRFLALPDQWMFNIETNGECHIWEEDMSEDTVH